MGCRDTITSQNLLLTCAAAGWQRCRWGNKPCMGCKVAIRPIPRQCVLADNPVGTKTPRDREKWRSERRGKRHLIKLTNPSIWERPPLTAKAPLRRTELPETTRPTVQSRQSWPVCRRTWELALPRACKPRNIGTAAQRHSGCTACRWLTSKAKASSATRGSEMSVSGGWSRAFVHAQ